MAKRDNNTDGTPIEFRVSNSASGKGPRIPIPINQPNWRYKRNTSSHRSELIISRIFLVATIALSILLIVSRLYKSPLWIGVIIFGIMAFISARSAKALKFNDENDTPPKRKDEKQPKDYK